MCVRASCALGSARRREAGRPAFLGRLTARSAADEPLACAAIIIITTSLTFHSFDCRRPLAASVLWLPLVFARPFTGSGAAPKRANQAKRLQQLSCKLRLSAWRRRPRTSGVIYSAGNTQAERALLMNGAASSPLGQLRHLQLFAFAHTIVLAAPLLLRPLCSAAAVALANHVPRRQP